MTDPYRPPPGGDDRGYALPPREFDVGWYDEPVIGMNVDDGVRHCWVRRWILVQDWGRWSRRGVVGIGGTIGSVFRLRL